jgi:hypothetical protein
LADYILKRAGSGDRRSSRGDSGVAVGDAGLVQVVLGHFDVDLVANGDADEIFAHLARDMREDFVAVGQFDPEHGAGQHLCDGSRQFDMLFSSHSDGQKVFRICCQRGWKKSIVSGMKNAVDICG